MTPRTPWMPVWMPSCWQARRPLADFQSRQCKHCNAIICDAESTPSSAAALELKGQSIKHPCPLRSGRHTGESWRCSRHCRDNPSRNDRIALSALRPHAPIYATTDSDVTARRLGFCWGMYPSAPTLATTWKRRSRWSGDNSPSAGLLRSAISWYFVNIHPDPTRPDANYLKIHRL